MRSIKILLFSIRHKLLRALIRIVLMERQGSDVFKKLYKEDAIRDMDIVGKRLYYGLDSG